MMCDNDKVDKWKISSATKKSQVIFQKPNFEKLWKCHSLGNPLMNPSQVDKNSAT